MPNPTRGQVSEAIDTAGKGEGLLPENDRLSRCLHATLLVSGQAIGEEEMAFRVGDYDRLHGWNAEGVPPVIKQTEA